MKQSVALGLVFLFVSCDRTRPPDTPPPPPPPPPVSHMLEHNDEAVALMSAERKSLYESLAKTSTQPIEVTVDIASKAVLSLGLRWSGSTGTPATDAREFIGRFHLLLDDTVRPEELREQEQRTPCETTVTFDRYVGDLQVVGSRLTFHFRNRQLIWVTNGLAPVPATRVEVSHPDRLPGASDLRDMVGRAPYQSIKRIPVLAPMHDLSGLYSAELAAWFDRGRYRGAVAIGDVAVSRAFDATEQEAGRSGAGPKAAAGEATEVPSMVFYRHVGGVPVSALPAERNPLEHAYRFLEEHPTLLRTGAARCQFVPVRLNENPTLPGIFTVKLQQQHGPYAVYGSDVVLRLEDFDRVGAVVARTRHNIEVHTQATLTETDALSRARAALVSPPPQWQGAVDQALGEPAHVELVVLPAFFDRDPQLPRDRLVWRVDMGSFTMMFDAVSGERVFETSSRHFADVIRDGQGNGVLGLAFYRTFSVDGTVVSPTPPPPDILPGFDGILGGLPTALSDYTTMLARNGHVGMRGNGRGDFLANVNVVFETGGCPNAFMDSYLSWNAFFCPGEATADILGHELTHGIIGATTGLIMSDQAGAINESYADILGDLADRTSNNVIGETAGSGTPRNLLEPALSVPPQPNHFSALVRRTPGPCAGSVFPWDCDFGFVHANSGIINRAHRLFADAVSAAPAAAGRGDELLERLALAVATTHLPSNATMHQVAGATRDLCETFVARGVTGTRTGAAFTTADCEAVTTAFRTVGLDPSLSSGWFEPVAGFEGSETVGPAGPSGVPPLTPNACPVTNIELNHRVPVLATVLTADYLLGTPMPPRTSILDFIATTQFNFAGLPTTTPGGDFFPISTPVTTHRVDWTSVYGVRPTFETDIETGTGCNLAGATTATSATVTRGFDAGNLVGAETVTVGNPTPTMLGGCVLGPAGNQLIELLDGGGTVIDGPRSDVHHTITHWFAFIPVDFTARAAIRSRPVGANMSGLVDAAWDLGRTVNVRWRYEFTVGSGCNPR